MLPVSNVYHFPTVPVCAGTTSLTNLSRNSTPASPATSSPTTSENDMEQKFMRLKVESDQQGPKWRRVRPAKGAEWEDGQGLVGGASREAFSSAPKGFPCSRVRFDRRDRVPKLPKGLACSLARRGLLAGARLRLKPAAEEGRPSIERLHFGRKREEKGVFIPHRDAMAAVQRPARNHRSGARGAHIVTS